nr:MAG TPA: hypothetical protein [Bacteriophage sp.]
MIHNAKCAPYSLCALCSQTTVMIPVFPSTTYFFAL